MLKYLDPIMHDKLDVLPVDVKVENFKRVILVQIMG